MIILETENIDDVLSLAKENFTFQIRSDINSMLKAIDSRHKREPHANAQVALFYGNCSIKGANLLLMNKNGTNGSIVYTLKRIDEDTTVRNDYTGEETIYKGYACD